MPERKRWMGSNGFISKHGCQRTWRNVDMPSSTYKIVAKKQVEIESKINEDEMKKK